MAVVHKQQARRHIGCGQRKIERRGCRIVGLNAGHDLNVGRANGVEQVVAAIDGHYLEREARLLLHVVQHAARYAFELAGFLVERLKGRFFGNNPHAQRAVIAGERKLLGVKRKTRAGLAEIFLVQVALQLGVAFVDALDGPVDLVDDRAVALRRREEERPPGERGDHVEPFDRADVDAEEGVGLPRSHLLRQLAVGGAFDGGVGEVVLLAEIVELFAALLRRA